jgi:hypothetical protein
MATRSSSPEGQVRRNASGNHWWPLRRRHGARRGKVALGYRAGRSEVWGSSSILDDLLHLSIIIPPSRRCCGPVGLRDSVEANMKMPTRELQTRAPALVFREFLSRHCSLVFTARTFVSSDRQQTLRDDSHGVEQERREHVRQRFLSKVTRLGPSDQPSRLHLPLNSFLRYTPLPSISPLHKRLAHSSHPFTRAARSK